MATRGKNTGRNGKRSGLVDGLEQRRLPLADPRDLDPLLDRIGNARYVLLGEATHGTSEFYTWRASLSERLIREKGFSFIAVEGDWPDCYQVNRYVKSYLEAGSSARDVLHAFERWPTWMWANREVVELAEWLHEHNRRLPSARQVGFYGLDVYSLWDSMHAVVSYLESVDPSFARSARAAYRCFEPYGEDVQEYARATAIVPTTCEREAVAVLSALRSRASDYREDGADAYFNAEQNALVARNAELYYRTMVRGGPTSWNVRDTHMVETLERLMKHHGPDAKAIVWEHNTHIGDARFTDMARAGMYNVGQLVRQGHDADDVVLVGFGTHRGTVIAGAEWGAPMQRMRVPNARRARSRTPFTRRGQGMRCSFSTAPTTAALVASTSRSAIAPSASCTIRVTRRGETTYRRSFHGATTCFFTSRRRSVSTRSTCPYSSTAKRRRRTQVACERGSRHQTALSCPQLPSACPQPLLASLGAECLPAAGSLLAPARRLRAAFKAAGRWWLRSRHSASGSYELRAEGCDRGATNRAGSALATRAWLAATSRLPL